MNSLFSLFLLSLCAGTLLGPQTQLVLVAGTSGAPRATLRFTPTTPIVHGGPTSPEPPPGILGKGQVGFGAETYKIPGGLKPCRLQQKMEVQGEKVKGHRVTCTVTKTLEVGGAD